MPPVGNSARDMPKWSSKPRLSLGVGLVLFVLAGPLSLAVWNLTLTFLEYRELRLYGLKVNAKAMAPSDPSVATGPIPDGVIVLVRKGDNVGAFVPTAQTLNPEQINYEWYYRTDGKPRLDVADPAVSSGRATAAWQSGQPLARVQFGPFSIKWSGSDNGWGWLYYDVADDPQQLCVTGRQTFVGVNPSDPKWVFTP